MNKRACEIIYIGKRRDGGSRYWCIAHRGDAPAKYGVRAEQCKYANSRFGNPEPARRIDLDDYPGGVALWGAVPPVYDTTHQPLDSGVHVHARSTIAGPKELDATYPRVEVVSGGDSWEIEELDAINQMVSSVLGIRTEQVICTYCGQPHLDKDWFSLYPHTRHLCASCGKHFKDSKKSVGNPIAAIAQRFPSRKPR